VPLPPRSAAALGVLVERAGEVVSKDELLDRVWEGAIVAEGSLAEAISKLRRALGDRAAEPRFVETLSARGYRFAARVAREPERRRSPEGTSARSRSAPRAGWRRRAAALAALVLGAVVAVPRMRRETPPVAIDLGAVDAEVSLYADPVALAPDGSRIFVAGRGGDQEMLVVLPDGSGRRRIRGTRGGVAPFVSPDGRRLGFLAGPELRTVPISGGEASSLGVAPRALGATWGPDGAVVVAAGLGAGLELRPGNGAAPRRLTEVDLGRGELAHLWPEVPAGGRWVLYTAWSGSIEEARLMAAALDGGEEHLLLEGAARARWTGRDLLMVRPWGLELREFDPLSGELGDRARRVDLPDLHRGARAAVFAVAGERLVSLGPRAGPRRLAVVERGAERASLPLSERATLHAANGGRLLLSLDRDLRLWEADVTLSALRRLGSVRAANDSAWSQDGRRVAWPQPVGREHHLLVRALDLPGQPVREWSRAESPVYPEGWAPAGDRLLVSRITAATGLDLFTLGEPGERPVPYRVSPADEAYAQISPRGDKVAFASNLTGSWELYVDDFPEPAGARRLTEGGGRDLAWAADGRSLYFRRAGWLWSVDPAGGAATRLSQLGGGLEQARPLAGGGWAIVRREGESRPELASIDGWRPSS
jgi:hypothetical protein